MKKGKVLFLKILTPGNQVNLPWETNLQKSSHTLKRYVADIKTTCRWVNFSVATG